MDGTWPNEVGPREKRAARAMQAVSFPIARSRLWIEEGGLSISAPLTLLAKSEKKMILTTAGS